MDRAACGLAPLHRVLLSSPMSSACRPPSCPRGLAAVLALQVLSATASWCSFISPWCLVPVRGRVEPGMKPQGSVSLVLPWSGHRHLAGADTILG